MTLNRRNFLRTSLSGAALAVGSTALASCSSKPANTAKGEKGSDKPGKDLELKLSFQYSGCTLHGRLLAYDMGRDL